MTQARFAAYLAKVNASDLGFVEFYHPDVWFDHGSTGGMLRGRDAIAAYYRNAWSQMRERITAKAVVIDNESGQMAVELRTELEATEDVTRTPGITMKKGDRVILTGMVIYGLDKGQIISIRGVDDTRQVIKAPAQP